LGLLNFLGGLPMKYLGFLLSAMLLFAGCSQLDRIGQAEEDIHKVSPKLDETNSQMAELKRLQSMAQALDGIKSQYSLERLSPVPTGLMPYAETFAEAAHENEIAKLASDWLSQIDQVTPIAGFGADGTQTAPTLQQQNDTLVAKFRDYQALSAIAAFIPEDTLHAMIDTEINNGGPYRPAALALLMMRADFITSALVVQQFKLEDPIPFNSIGEVEQANAYMMQVEEILRLHFTTNDVSLTDVAVKTTGIVTPPHYNGPIANADEKLDADTVAGLASAWQMIVTKAKIGMNIKVVKDSKGQILNTASYNSEIARGNAAIALAQKYANGWAAKP